MYTHSLIQLFLDDKRIGQGLAITSIKLYQSAFNHLGASDEITLDDMSTLTSHNFKRLLYSLNTQRNWSAHAYNRVRKDLSVFCKWLVAEKLLKENPMLLIPIKILPKKLPKHFTNDQLDKMKYLLHRIYPDDGFISMRAKCMYYTYLYTGLRLYELIDLKPHDIDYYERTITVKDGKGGKERRIPLLRVLQPVLEDYTKVREGQPFDSPYLFPTAFGGRLQHREIYGIIKRMRNSLDFHITPHMFRHTFATELARKNLNIYNISQILGHSNINTTKIYLTFQCADIGRQIDSIDIYK